MVKLFVWDFHGTLEQGNEKAVREISNLILERNGYDQRFTEEEVNKELYGKKWYQYFEILLPNEEKNVHLNLQNQCVEYSLSHPEIVAKYIKPTNYAHLVLEEISKIHSQVIISNCEPEGILMFVESVKMTHYFNEENTFAINAHLEEGMKTKSDALKSFLIGKTYSDFVFIGDSIQDIILKKEFGGTSYLYTHPGRDFKKCGDFEPDFRIRNLIDILAKEGLAKFGFC